MDIKIPLKINASTDGLIGRTSSIIDEIASKTLVKKSDKSTPHQLNWINQIHICFRALEQMDIQIVELHRWN